MSFLKALNFTNILNHGLLGIAALESASETLQAVFFALGALICIAEGYFIGAFSPAIYFSKKLYGSDVRESGSGNAGSTNMLRTHGKKAGLITALGDFFKGVLTALLGYIAFGYNGAAIAGLFAVVGHIAPVYYKFKGGKGVMVAASVLLMLDPVVFLITIAMFAVIVYLTKYVSLGSIMAALVYPLVFVRVGGHLGIPAITNIITGALIIFMHRGNMTRLKEGTENKLSFGKKKTEEKSASDDGTESVQDEETKDTDNADEYAVSEKKPQPKSKKNQKKLKKGKK